MKLEEIYEKVLEKPKELRELGIDPVSLLRHLGHRQPEAVRERRDLSEVKGMIRSLLGYSVTLTAREILRLLKDTFENTSDRKAYLTVAALLRRMETTGEVVRTVEGKSIKFTI